MVGLPPAPTLPTIRIVLNYAVLVGLTPLIPVPVLDDVVKTHFYRGMVRSLAHANRLALSDAEIAALAQERGSGCLYGCTLGAVEFLAKRLVQKAIFVLEWRRAVDLVTHTYYSGRLLAFAFERGWYKPGDRAGAARLRAAVDQA